MDFQKRIDEGVDPGLEFMYRDAEEARQDSAFAHPSAQLAAETILLLRSDRLRWHDSSDRLRMKLGRSACRSNATLETEAGGHSFEYASIWPTPLVSSPHDSIEERRRVEIVSDGVDYRTAHGAAGCRCAFSSLLGFCNITWCDFQVLNTLNLHLIRRYPVINLGASIGGAVPVFDAATISPAFACCLRAGTFPSICRRWRDRPEC